MISRWALALLGLLLCVPLAAEASSIPLDTAEAMFALDASQHRLEAGRVGVMRGGNAAVRIRRWNEGAPASVAGVTIALNSASGSAFPQGTAVLFYAQRADGLAIYLIDRRGLRVADLTPASPLQIAEAVDDFRLSLGVATATTRAAWLGSQPRFSGEPRRLYDHDAQALADVLLPGAIAEQLGGVTDLIVVADGTISQVPFAALPNRRGGVLIDTMSISVAAGLYDISRTIQPWDGESAFSQALVVGNPTVPVIDGRVSPSLIGAEAEARALAASFGVAPLLGADATKAAVVQRAQSAQLLYFASHGASDPETPLTGGLLMLAGTDRASSSWTAQEIQQLRFVAQLAVLSACQTGLGGATAGGTIGLSRAFHIAGVPRVIMSLWNVDDLATLYLMQRFSQYAVSQSPAQALRHAMLDARSENDDPALWSSFTLFGTPR